MSLHPLPCLACLLLLMSGAALADGAGGGVGISSAHIQRGISPSGGRPSVFTDLYYRWDSGWQASLGLARWPARPTRASGDYAASLARQWQLDDDWSAAVSASHWGPLGGDVRRRADYDDLSLSLAWQGRLTLLLAVSPNTTGTSSSGVTRTGTVLTWEAAWHQRLAGRVALDAGVGAYDNHALGRPGYRYASLGLSSGFGPLLTSVSYVTNHGPAASLVGTLPPEYRRSRWLGTVVWVF